MKLVFVSGTAIGLFVLLTVSVGCNANGAAQDNDDKSPASKLVTVRIVKAERVEMSRTIRQPATVHADQQANIYAKASGYLEKVEADIGKQVKANDPLAIISVPEMAKQKARQEANIRRFEAEVAVATASAAKAKANVKKSRSRLTAAESEHGRVADLVKKKAVADKLLDEAKEKHEAAKADKEVADEEVLLAQANVTLATENENVARAELAELVELIKYATLRAPFKGVVVARNVDQGDLVRNTQSSGKDGPPLYVVAKTDPVRVRVAIPEREASLIEIGQEAHVTLQAMSGQPILIDGKPPKVTRKAGGLDESTRTLLVEIDIPNPDGHLIPGMFGEATIVTQPNQSRLVLPANVVRYDEHGKSYVFVVNSSDKVKVVDVTTGLDTGNQIEITAGLTGEERIAAAMIRRLKAGQKVKVAE